MSLTKVEAKVDTQTPFVRIISLDKSYVCVNCDSVVHAEDMMHGKAGSSCPSCGSRQVFPMTAWFKEANA